jgi:hypothetical protein
MVYYLHSGKQGIQIKIAAIGLERDAIAIRVDRYDVCSFYGARSRRFYCKDSFSAAHAHRKEGDTVNIGWITEDSRTSDPSD